MTFNASNVKQDYRVTKRNAYPTPETDRYRNQIGYSRFGSMKCRELASAVFLAPADLVQWGRCGFCVDGCG
ncbi:hypothetical protein K503DRAFT_773011 [Rhizopogon vinicolor AM-OR11-026]|uniref:Uncharacterized protein n=1 Tax=Rhizopogon vinicolor AM-OR11-026 TaxID=1314800 RepID=A0A1B7MTF3_9AGAM|nr:hypothetical protein K503DRAFT_773011 [Rhizopogon vinicolor AM-OR11-026]